MTTGNFFDIYQNFSWVLLNSVISLLSCWLTIYFFLSHHCIFFWIRISKLQDQLYSLSTARSYKKLVLDRLVLWICDCLNKFKMKSNHNFFSAFNLQLQYCLTLPLLNVVNSCCLFSKVTYCYAIINKWKSYGYILCINCQCSISYMWEVHVICIFFRQIQNSDSFYLSDPLTRQQWIFIVFTIYKWLDPVQVLYLCIFLCGRLDLQLKKNMLFKTVSSILNFKKAT